MRPIEELHSYLVVGRKDRKLEVIEGVKANAYEVKVGPSRLIQLDGEAGDAGYVPEKQQFWVIEESNPYLGTPSRLRVYDKDWELLSFEDFEEEVLHVAYIPQAEQYVVRIYEREGYVRKPEQCGAAFLIDAPGSAPEGSVSSRALPAGYFDPLLASPSDAQPGQPHVKREFERLPSLVDAGGTITIDYPRTLEDLGESGELKNIKLCYQVEGRAIEKSQITKARRDKTLERVPGEIKLSSNARGDLSYWFELRTQDGRTIYDNQDGENYHATIRPDLAFGETVVSSPRAELPEIPAAQKAQVDRVFEAGQVGDARDAELLQQSLAALHPDILRELADAGYKFSFGRNNVANGAAGLKGARVGGARIDDAEGIHSVDPEHGRRIVVKTWMRDGKVTLDVSTLLHEIGHAYDLVLRAEGADGLHVEAELAEAYQAEYKNYSESYYHDQKEFVAESIGRYLIDPEKFRSEFRSTAAAFDKLLRTPGAAVDTQRLVALNQSMLEKAPVTPSQDVDALLEEYEVLNQVREARRDPRQPYVVEFDGELPAAEALGRQMAHALRYRRRPDIAPGGLNDGFTVVPASTFNDAEPLKSVLADAAAGHGGMVLVTGLDQVPSTSPGFEVLKRFFAQNGDAVPVLAHGPAEGRAAFLKQLPGALKAKVEIAPLEPAQTAELIRRYVANDGYSLTQEAMEFLAEKARGGYAEALELWDQVKQAQHRRVAELPEGDLNLQPAGVGYVLRRDVEGANLAPKESAMERLDKTIGLDVVKSRLKQDLAAARVRQRDIEAGLNPPAARALRYFFLGNPGLGKTTVASVVEEVLFEAGATNKRAELVRGQDLTSAQAVLELFRRNRGGTIIIDEMHQMALKTETKEAFRALIPLIEQENPEFKGTAFIGMGYTEEMRTLFRELDQGGEGRMRPFELVFPDMNKDELAAVLDQRIASSDMIVPAEVREAMLERVVDEQRGTFNPGNARDVVSTWNRVLAGRDGRMAALDAGGSKVSPQARRTLELADLPKTSREDPDAILREFGEKFVGAEEACRVLQGFVDTVRLNELLGNDAFDGLGPYVALSGPAGTGKTELAGYLARLYAALGFTGRSEVMKVSAADLIANFVGQTASLTRDALRKAFGGTLFIDEVGAVANAVGGYADEAVKEIVAIINDPKYRKSLGVVIADYPHNIDKFFKMDDGLQRRFDTRVELKVPASDALVPLLQRNLEARNLDTRQIDGRLAAALEEFLAVPNFGGAGGVQKLADSIFRAHAQDVQARLRKGEKLDKAAAAVVRPEAFDNALEAERQKIPKTSGRSNPSSANLQFQTQAAVQKASDAEEAKAPVPLSTDEKRQHQAYLKVIQQPEWAELSKRDPQAFEAAAKDPNSELARQLGAALNTSPEDAVARVRKVLVRVQELVTFQVKVKKQRFDYICFACGGINGGGGCGYYPRYKDDLPWLIAHSRRPPYEVEEIEELQELRDRVVEQEVQA